MAREMVLFFILFSAGLLVVVFLGIVWITRVLEQTARTMKDRVAERMTQAMRSMKPRRTVAQQY